MKELKDYWWIVITIPALTILIYLLTKKSMKGIAILSTIFGIVVIISWIVAYPIRRNTNLFIGITWLALGIGWFICHCRKKVE